MGTETTQIIDLNAAEGKAVQEGEKGWNLLGKLYDGALKGIPGAKSVEALAQEYLSNCGGKKEQAAEQLIRMHDNWIFDRIGRIDYAAGNYYR